MLSKRMRAFKAFEASRGAHLGDPPEIIEPVRPINRRPTRAVTVIDHEPGGELDFDTRIAQAVLHLQKELNTTKDELAKNRDHMAAMVSVFERVVDRLEARAVRR